MPQISTSASQTLASVKTSVSTKPEVTSASVKPGAYSEEMGKTAQVFRSFSLVSSELYVVKLH